MPETIQQTGFLTDLQGDPHQGQALLRFSLYGQADGGEVLWSEEHNLNLNGGYYSVTLGVQTLFGDVFDTSPRFMSVAVGGVEMQPRIQLSSVPYALIAQDAVGDISPHSVSVGGQEVIDASGHWVGPGDGGGQTPAEILTAIKTVDGAGSGLDADTLDGLNSAAFIQNGEQVMALVLAADGVNSGLDADRLDGHDSSAFVRTAAQLIELLLTVDGANSSLDADRLDGHDSSAFVRTAAQIMALLLDADGSGSNLDADKVDGLHASKFMRVDVDTGTSGNLGVGGVITATSFLGDGSELTGIAAGSPFDQDLNRSNTADLQGLHVRPYDSSPIIRQSEAHSGWVSDTGHIVSESGNSPDHGIARAGWKAFDEGNNYWCAPSGTQGWIGYEFVGNKRVITQYRMQSYGNTSNPSTWQFQGWDGEKWVILHDQNVDTNWPNLEWKTFDVPSQGQLPYQKFRIYVFSVHSGGWLCIREFELLGYEASVQITKQTERHDNWVSSSGHTVTESGNSPDHGVPRAGWKAFDLGSPGWFAPAGTQGWIGYEFAGNKRIITQYRIQAWSGTNYRPDTWQLQGWDGNNWIILHDQDTPANGWSNNWATFDVPISGQIPLHKFRINILSVASGGWLGMREFEMLGYEDVGPPSIFLGNDGNLSLSGTVDGVDVSENIDQDVRTTASPSFAGLTVNGVIKIHTYSTSNLPPECTSSLRGSVINFQPGNNPDRICWCKHTGSSIYKWTDMTTGAEYSSAQCN